LKLEKEYDKKIKWITKHHYRESNDKNSLQHISNCMC